LRSIEEGVPLVRSANGGLSAVIDAYGRQIAGLRLGESAAFTSPLPQPIEPPLFARLGFLSPLLLILVFMLPAVYGIVTQRSFKRSA
jgi:apolipoprotein N-acyltransferase